MDNCKNCAGTINKNNTCDYCGTYYGPLKSNKSLESVSYSNSTSGYQLTGFAKMLVAIMIIGFAYFAIWLFIDSGYVFNEEYHAAAPIFFPRPDSSATVHLMPDGDINLVMYRWNSVMGTTYFTVEDKLINK